MRDVKNWHAVRTVIYHIIPVTDATEHELDGCACGPRLEPVTHSDGTTGHVVRHWALDNGEDPSDE